MATFSLKKKNPPAKVQTTDDLLKPSVGVAVEPDDNSATNVSPLCRPRLRRGTKSSSQTQSAAGGKGKELLVRPVDDQRTSAVPNKLDCSGNGNNGRRGTADGKRCCSPSTGLSPPQSAIDSNRRASDGGIGSRERCGSGTWSPGSGSGSLEPRIKQYEKNELLQDRSPDTGLTEVEAFLLEKQRQLEAADANDDEDDRQDSGPLAADEPANGLVPRAPFYQPHPLLQVRTEVGMTELELYLMEKDANLEQQQQQQPEEAMTGDSAEEQHTQQELL